MTDNDKKLAKKIRNDATYMKAGGLRDLAATMTQVADRIEALSTEVEDYRMAANAEASGLNDYKTRVHVLEEELKAIKGNCPFDMDNVSHVSALSRLKRISEIVDDVLKMPKANNMNITFTKAKSSISGTHLVGYITVEYNRLCEIFGPPTHEGDGEKVDAEWQLEFDDGVIATIYNYKNGKNYLGIMGPNVEDITEWNIGGHDQRAVLCVYRALNL